jgi:hypothetical protein
MCLLRSQRFRFWRCAVDGVAERASATATGFGPLGRHCPDGGERFVESLEDAGCRLRQR